MGIYTYIDIDYQDGKLGVRFEPKNLDVVQAMVTNIPSHWRFFHSGKRRWILDPVTGPVLVKIILNFLPNTPMQIESKNKDLILSLLFGPESFENRVVVNSDVLRQGPIQLGLGGPTATQWMNMNAQRSK